MDTAAKQPFLDTRYFSLHEHQRGVLGTYIRIHTHTYERDMEDMEENVVGFALYILYLIWVKWVEGEEREIGGVGGPGREVDNVKCMVAQE